MKHADHTKQIKRLNRISGQIEGIKKMIESGKYCIDILNQTKAIRSAVKSLEAEILTNHLDHCVKNTFKEKSSSERKKKIDEIIEVFKKRL